MKGAADIYKKAASLYVANGAAMSSDKSFAFGIRLKPSATFGIDRLGMTVGDLVFEHFRISGLLDFVSEKIIQHIFSVRAFVDANDSKALVVAQVQADSVSREKLVRRLESANGYLSDKAKPEIKTAQYENLKTSWDNFKNTSKKAPDVVRDARLAVAVMLIEGMNFKKIMSDCISKNDGKSWILLSASAATIVSGLFDVASAPAKSIFGDPQKIISSSDSWTNQKLKLVGGSLSLYATTISVLFDIGELEKNVDQGNDVLRKLYLAKVFLGLANAGTIVLTTYTYSAPTISRLTATEVVYASAENGLSVTATRIIGYRMLFMSVGTWITAISVGIQLLIWYYDRQKLKFWCDSCAFGKKRNKDWGVETQIRVLTDALDALGIRL